MHIARAGRVHTSREGPASSRSRGHRRTTTYTSSRQRRPLPPPPPPSHPHSSLKSRSFVSSRTQLHPQLHDDDFLGADCRLVRRPGPLRPPAAVATPAAAPAPAAGRPSGAQRRMDPWHVDEPDGGSRGLYGQLRWLRQRWRALGAQRELARRGLAGVSRLCLFLSLVRGSQPRALRTHTLWGANPLHPSRWRGGGGRRLEWGGRETRW